MLERGSGGRNFAPVDESAVNRPGVRNHPRLVSTADAGMHTGDVGVVYPHLRRLAASEAGARFMERYFRLGAGRLNVQNQFHLNMPSLYLTLIESDSLLIPKRVGF